MNDSQYFPFPRTDQDERPWLLGLRLQTITRQYAMVVASFVLMMTLAGGSQSFAASYTLPQSPRNVPLPSSTKPLCSSPNTRLFPSPLPQAQALRAGIERYLQGQLSRAQQELAKTATEVGPLQAYILYYQGLCEFKLGRFQYALNTFDRAAQSPGKELLRRDLLFLRALCLEYLARYKAALARYQSWLAQSGNSLRAYVQLRAAVCASRIGQSKTAANLLETCLKTYPWTNSAAAATTLAHELHTQGTIAFNPNAETVQRKMLTRLIDRGKGQDALQLADKLLKTTADRNRILYYKGKALYRLRKTRKSIETLEHVVRSAPQSGLAPWALYHQAKGYWRYGKETDEADMESALQRVLAMNPSDARVVHASRKLLMLYLIEHARFAEALKQADILVATAGPKTAKQAQWLGAILPLALGRPSQAVERLAAYTSIASGAEEQGAVHYFSGKALMANNQLHHAAAQFKYTALTWPNTYYGYESARLLAQLRDTANIDPHAVKPVAPIPGAPRCPTSTNFDPGIAATTPASNRALVLESVGLNTLALPEWEAASRAKPHDGGLACQSARLAATMGKHMDAARPLWRTFGGCLFRGSPEGLMPIRSILYPQQYASDIIANLQGTDIDPTIISSLIRQESYFNPSAVSGVGAIGLMQIMPATGKTIASWLKDRSYSRNKLFNPAFNLRYGITYFKRRFSRYNAIVPTLCSYNAGFKKADVWNAHLGNLDQDLFIAFIPYTETRNYVRRILNNATMYRRLW